MKSITEILGGAQFLLGVSFDIQDTFEEYLSEEQRAFLVILRLIEEDFPVRTRLYGGRGRIPMRISRFSGPPSANRSFRYPRRTN